MVAFNFRVFVQQYLSIFHQALYYFERRNSRIYEQHNDSDVCYVLIWATFPMDKWFGTKILEWNLLQCVFGRLLDRKLRICNFGDFTSNGAED